MRGKNSQGVRTVVLPHPLEEPLLRALCDVSSAVNQLIPDWRAHAEESRFEATKRSYRWLREHYAHLASSWAVTIANETTATLGSWDKLLRRARRHDPTKFARIKDRLPHRKNLKASLHRAIYRLDGKVLDITVSPDRHVRIDLSGTKNPLFWKYLEESGGEFGLALTDRKLVFNFRISHPQPVVERSMAVDLNMPTADYVTSDGRFGLVGLREISRIQGAMARKRRSIQAAIPTDLKAQRRVLRRYGKRQTNRVTPLLHKAANQLLKVAGDRNIILEDLSNTTEDCLKQTTSDAQRRKLSAWTHGAFQRIVTYKASTAVVKVNPRGSSSTCPRCGGPLAHPTWRQSDCGNCQGRWHRDWGAAIVLLDRGHQALRGATPRPSARNVLLEAASQRLALLLKWNEALRTSTRKGDDAKHFGLV